MGKRVMFLSDSIGADEELGRILMKNFIYSVARNAEAPSCVMFMNTAVRLVCEGSDSLDDIRILAENGVPVKACGTCLDFLKLKDKLAVGEVGNMVEAVEALLGDDDVLTIA